MKLENVSENALENFVYIVGVARGGTTILRDAVGVHDNILMMPGMTHFMSQVWRYRNKLHTRLLRQIFGLPMFYREKEVLNSLESNKKYDLERHINAAFKKRDMKAMWQLYPEMYLLDAKYKKNIKKVECWGDKANDVYGLRKIGKAFSKAKFIFLVRDPRAAVCSIAKRMFLKDRDNANLNNEYWKIVEASIYWRNMVQKMVYFAQKNKKKTLFIKFEDFLQRPENELNKIFEFLLGRNMDEKTIKKRMDELQYRASNRREEKGKGINKSPIKRWKKNLSKEEVQLISCLTAKTAQKIGYGIRKERTDILWRQLQRKITKQKMFSYMKILYLSIFENAICPINH